MGFKLRDKPFWFVLGCLALTIVMLLAVTCRAYGQTPTCKTGIKASTASWHNLPTAKGAVQRGDTILSWQTQKDSVARRDVCNPTVPPKPPVDTTPKPPPVDTTPPPPPPPPPPPSGAVLLRESFDPPNTAMLTAFGGQLSGSHVIDPTGGRNGSGALKVTISGSDRFNPVQLNWSAQGRIFMRWYFRTQGVPGGNVKGYRFHDGVGGTNLGEVYGGNPCWSFDQEGQAACVDVGMSYTSATPDCPALANSGWHSIEVEYARNAGSQVEARLWCDGKGIVLPTGSARYFDGPWPEIQFTGGDRASNTPSWIFANRVYGGQTISAVGLWEMISQAGGTATVWVDDIVVSTQRIGP